MLAKIPYSLTIEYYVSLCLPSPSTQYITVSLPAGFTCNRCVLQLLRQAGEWTANGGYYFFSCADISIQDNAGIIMLL